MPKIPLIEVKSSEVPEEQTSLRCGWLSYRPDWLQCLNAPKPLLAFLCFAATIQGMTQMGFVNVCLTTIEKRFHFKSQDTGTIVGAFNVAFVLCCMPVCFLASRRNASKPRWLGWGMIIMALGSFLYAYPHYLLPQYRPANEPNTRNVASSILCTKNSTIGGCPSGQEAALDSFLPYFIAGQVLQGIGSTPIYILGMVFIDESVPSDMSSLYIGIFSAMLVGGAALGFAVGSSLLKLYIDWPVVDPATVNLTPESDLWLGCWWICFVIAGCLSILAGTAILAFPRKLRSTRTNTSESYIHVQDLDLTSDSSSDTDIISFLREILEVCRNRTFMALTLAEAGPSFLGQGLGAFMPKIIENQFNLSASTAALYVGFAAVPAGCLGSITGGWLLKKLNMDCRQCLMICTYGALALFLSSFAFLIYCENPEFDGITVQNNFPPVQLPNLKSQCNSGCNCDSVPYNPVCGANRVIYYSPCHAGCTDKIIIAGREVFHDCNCVVYRPTQKHQSSRYSAIATGIKENSVNAIKHKNVTTKEENSLSNNVKHNIQNLKGTIAFRDKCPSTCNLLPAFLGIFMIITFIGFALSMPSVSAGFRCIEDGQKSMAFGLRAQLTRLFGSIPGPIIFGIFIDKTCLHWGQSCDGQGSCDIYEFKNMSYTALYMSLWSRGLDLIFFALAWWCYVKPSRLKHRISVDQYSVPLLQPSEEYDSAVRHR